MIGKLTPGCSVLLRSGKQLTNVAPHPKGGWVSTPPGKPSIRFTPDQVVVASPPELFDIAVAHARQQGVVSAG